MQHFKLELLRRPVPSWGLLLALLLGFATTYLLMFGLPAVGSAARGGGGWATTLTWSMILIAATVLIGAGMVLLPRVPKLVHDAPPKEALRDKILFQTGSQLNLELGKVLGVIRTRIGTDESYGKSLAEAQARLGQLTTPEQVRVIVSLLVAENHRMRLDSANMSKQLEASRQQIEGLRVRLEKAYEVGLQDPLTSVGNRRCFDISLNQALGVAKAGQGPVSIVLGDLDSFKKINDEFGHQVGDEVLKFFTQLMVANVRDGDTVARFGGEEFAIILPHCPGREAAGIAERIRTKLSAKSLTIRRTSQDIGLVTASFGVAEFLAGENADALVSRADAALYEAKKTGRNRVVAG